ncbi:MAG: ribonuclease Y [Phycisphaerae bacterium]|nr:ribonuclease Y [Phycisphaerae bacterium]
MGPLSLLAASDFAPSTILFFGGIIGLIAGVVGTYVVLELIGRQRRSAIRRESERILSEANKEAERIVQKAEVDAKAEFIKRKEQFEKETAQTRNESKEAERRLDKREDVLERKLDTLNTKERSIENAERQMAERETQLGAKEKQLAETLEQQRANLLRISGMSVQEAKDLLLRRISDEVEHEAAELIDKTITEAQESAEARARDITITAIQRYAADHTCDSTVSTIDIPSDDMKGRVIGREGRNIRAFEKATGVDVIVDDTPGVVVVSAFDPVRREVARRAMENLIQDGRIHPARIEEVVEDIRKRVEKEILEVGKKAAMEANVLGLNRSQLDLLGRLTYRTSYGQNVLRHSIEVAFLSQVMADELGLDGALARRCGLLHDIGKAVDHEVEGAHPQIGCDICKKFKEKPEVLNAIAGHHGDIPAISPYTPLVGAADAISASRPGSRRESLERYVRRLEQLEELAHQFPGVKQAFAIQAGREVRVIVDADRVDDKSAIKIARDIAKKIEEEMTYPGEVKVTLLREVRAVEFAR